MNNRLWMALERQRRKAALRGEAQAWGHLTTIYGRRRASQALAICNATARAIAHVQRQWIAAGIDKGE